MEKRKQVKEKRFSEKKKHKCVKKVKQVKSEDDYEGEDDEQIKAIMFPFKCGICGNYYSGHKLRSGSEKC